MATTDTYTCPMHAEIRQSAPGTCPKCGMALECVAPAASHGATEYVCPRPTGSLDPCTSVATAGALVPRGSRRAFRSAVPSLRAQASEMSIAFRRREDRRGIGRPVARETLGVGV